MSVGADALCAKGTRRRVILALRDPCCLFVSASVEMSPSPKLATATSAGPELQQRRKSTQVSLNAKAELTHTLLMIHGSIHCGVSTLLT